jgi:hypothetical protein
MSTNTKLNIIERFARQEGISEQEIRNEMQAAIDEGMQSGAMAEMFPNHVPEPDELIEMIIKNLISGTEN